MNFKVHLRRTHQRVHHFKREKTKNTFCDCLFTLKTLSSCSIGKLVYWSLKPKPLLLGDVEYLGGESVIVKRTVHDKLDKSAGISALMKIILKLVGR